MTPRTNEQVLLSFYERVQPFGLWSTTARKAGDRPRAPIEAFRRRAQAIVATALSLFLLLFGVGRLMISPPDANVLWTWVTIVAGLALVPLWWRELAQEDLEVDRSLRPEDIQVTDRTLLEEPEGLLLALRQLGQHMKLVYGMEVEVEPRGGHRVMEDGHRILLFQVTQDLLLYMAGRERLAKTRVILGEENGRHLVQLEPEGEGFDFGRAPRAAPGQFAFAYDVLEHVSERLSHVNGRLRLEPDRRHARRIVMTTLMEDVGARPDERKLSAAAD